MKREMITQSRLLAMQVKRYNGCERSIKGEQTTTIVLWLIIFQKQLI